MKRGRVSSSLYIGILQRPGPPEPLIRVPFGQQSATRDAFDLSPAQFSVVVALLAAEVTGMGPVTINQIEEVTGGHCHSIMPSLVRGLWAENAGRVQKSRERIWKPSRRAWRQLFPNGWRVAA